MLNALLGKKIGMTQVFNEKGEVTPVTIIEIEDAIVVDKKTEEKDGYYALKIGYMDVKKPKNIPKPIKGIFKNEKKKLDLPLKKILREIKVSKEDIDKYNIGDVVSIKEFEKIKYVDITGKSKGKGFQGVVKRWGFKGGPSAHGSMQHRAPGSIGASSFPSRVFKNQKMAGHMGNETVTIQNLEVQKVDTENKFLLVKGCVPGNKGSILYIKTSVKKNRSEK